jgi:hypothetical protein
LGNRSLVATGFRKTLRVNEDVHCVYVTGTGKKFGSP